MEDAEMLDLKKQVTRGRRAEVFLRGETWGDMEAELARRQKDMAMACHWTPTKVMTLDNVALMTAYHSGRSEELEHLIVMFAYWVRDGQEAADKLKAMGIEL